MDFFDWLRILAAALGGGLTVKALDIAYQEYRSKSARKDEAKRFVDSHITPLLKAADELAGKMRSLAVDDYRPLSTAPEPERARDEIAMVYLLAKFWANIEIFREGGLTVDFIADGRGRDLQRFIDCLESKPIRLADRISQRAIGELMLERSPSGLATISFLEFLTRIEDSAVAFRWIEPLRSKLQRSNHTRHRQSLVAYGLVVNALIDTLDPSHSITRKRPNYSGKLTRKTWKSLNYRVFGTYLKNVSDKHKYIGPPK